MRVGYETLLITLRYVSQIKHKRIFICIYIYGINKASSGEIHTFIRYRDSLIVYSIKYNQVSPL